MFRKRLQWHDCSLGLTLCCNGCTMFPKIFQPCPLRNLYPQRCREEACWGNGKVVAAGEMHGLDRGEPVFSRWWRPYLLDSLTLWFPGKAQHGLWSHSRCQKPVPPTQSHHIYDPQIHRSSVAFVMESREQKAVTEILDSLRRCVLRVQMEKGQAFDYLIQALEPGDALSVSSRVWHCCLCFII